MNMWRTFFTILTCKACKAVNLRLRQRLQTGSLVRELAERGERICGADVVFRVASEMISKRKKYEMI